MAIAGDGITAVGGRLARSPSSADFSCGQAITLSIAPDGLPPASFTWKRNGTVIAGQSGASLSLTTTATELDAEYSVMVSGSPESEVRWPRIRLASIPAINGVAIAGLAKVYRYAYSSSPPCGGNQSGSGTLEWNACNANDLPGATSFSFSDQGNTSTCGCYSDFNARSRVLQLRITGPTELQLAASWQLTAPAGGPVQVEVWSNGATVWQCAPVQGQVGPASQQCSTTIVLAAGLTEIRMKAEPAAAVCQGTNTGTVTAAGTLTPLYADCNRNSLPDADDLAQGTSADRDGNGTPDECQTVRVPGDHATIQAAIDAAPPSGMTIVQLASGTYPGPIDFRGKPIVVRGAGAGSSVVEGTGGAAKSVVTFSGGEPAVAALESLTVRGGNTGSPLPNAPQYFVGGGVFGTQGAASVRDCIVESNASGFGGGAYFLGCSGTIERCTFRGNQASSDGGGLQAFGGQLRVVDTVITANECGNRGGGAHLVGGTPAVRRTVIHGNQSAGFAGGISWVPEVGSAPFVVFDEITVEQNAAGTAQGGLAISPSASNGAAVTCSIRGSRACGNAPQPNIAGPFVDLGGNEVCSCAGDLQHDGTVGGADLGLLLAAWGPCGTDCGEADLDSDGTIGGADLGLLLAAWGPCGG
jgi:hypothetical protein